MVLCCVRIKEKKKAVLTKEEEVGKWWRESASLLRLKSGVSVSAGVCAQTDVCRSREGWPDRILQVLVGHC